MADQIGEWSEQQVCYLSDKPLSNSFGLKVTKGDIYDNTIHMNNSYQLSRLKPEYIVKYKMELRECLPKGRKKMDDLEKCMACQPRLLFIE